MTRAFAPAIACIFLATASPACASHSAVSATQSPYAESHWQDVFEAMPELLVVLRPKALRRDKVYGPLLRRALEAARQRSRMVAATPLDAVEDADEVLYGARPEERDRPAEQVIVVRGVAASMDPGKLVDADGRALWAPGPNGRVRELIRERDERGQPIGASLFELPGQVWVVAEGGARIRARDAFSHPMSRPPFDLDPNALAIIRFYGPALVDHLRILRPHGSLEAAGRKLQSVQLLLPAGAATDVRATLSYSDEDAAAVSEVALRSAGDIMRGRPEKLPWFATTLAAAKVERPNANYRTVVVTAPLPPALVEGLLHAGTAPIDIDVPPP